jgi:hypothetical protein
MSLNLKVNLPEKNLVKVMRFSPDMSVFEALKEIKDKTDIGGADHGIFMPAGATVPGGKWLAEKRLLSFYELANMVRQ